MKRSQINRQINLAFKFFEKMRFPLPPFAYFSPQDWKHNLKQYKEVVDCKLGWDVTDFGSSEFEKTGRVIFTLRNGNKELPQKYPKPYAQKVMWLKEGQLSPIHYHKNKTEDIINQGGGVIGIKLWRSTSKDRLSSRSLDVSINGSNKKVRAGKAVFLDTGDSITIVPKTYHQFWAVKNRGDVLSMEISSLNDDENDNFWLEKQNRFPEIIENEPIKHFLCHEYHKI